MISLFKIVTYKIVQQNITQKAVTQITALKDRSLLILNGPDAKKLIQYINLDCFKV